MKKLLPNFRVTFLIVGFTFILLPLGLFAKGLINSMADFKVPEPILNSAHYYDAMLWVYVHMMVIGLLILIIGYSVNEIKKQKWIAILLFIVTAFYTYLDFRSADWMFGNALYKGDSSIVPAIISLLVNLLFFQLAIRLFTIDKTTLMNNSNNNLSGR